MNKQQTFIQTIAPLARAEYTSRAKWILPSVCIAQAALESGWNLQAKTLFGIKGNGANLQTTEYISGKWYSVTAAFKQYPSIAAAVHGYYDLLTGSGRYAKAVNCSDPYKAADAIAAAGYATAPQYAETVKRIIRQYNLAQYDKPLATAPAGTQKSVTDIAREVIRGKWGNGATRKSRLRAAGYDPAAVQAEVNRQLEG